MLTYWTKNLGPKLRTFWRARRRIQNWPTAVGLRLQQRRPGLRLLAFRDGLNVVCRGATPDWEVLGELALAGGYGLALDYLARQPGQPLVLDLGANIGVFSLLAAARHPEALVHAYEPGPPNLRILEMNRLANPTLGPRIYVHAEAVGGTSRPEKFFYDEQSPMSSGFWRGQGNMFTVQVRALSEILNALPGPVAVAKIDIEGAEFEMLEQTPKDLWARINAISMEIHDDPAGHLTLPGFLDRFAALGYRWRKEPVATTVYYLER